MPPNDYLAVCADYLGREQPAFKVRKIRKTLVSSAMIDWVAARLGAELFEVQVGFKWFVEGLKQDDICFCGEESAGSSFLRKDATVWTTDKDGLIASLLAAEMTAITDVAPDQLYGKQSESLGKSYYARIDRPANTAVRARIAHIEPEAICAKQLAGNQIIQKINKAPGNDAPIGGIKLATEKGWIAARTSGIEDTYKIYAESFVESQVNKLLLSLVV